MGKSEFPTEKANTNANKRQTGGGGDVFGGCNVKPGFASYKADTSTKKKQSASGDTLANTPTKVDYNSYKANR